MSNSLNTSGEKDSRILSIDTERVLTKNRKHYGVIDIGSNSIRLVVYDDLGRAPFPRFNEKSMIALGAGLDANDNFTEATMGDMGGGSLEVAEVLTDSIGERMTSMPLGALPITEKLKDGYANAKKHVDHILSDNLPPMLTNPVFFAVGGGWRALARIHIAMHQKPINVVHGYELAGEEVRSLARNIAKMSPEEIAELPDVPSRRIPTMAASALVMSRVLRKLKPDRVAFSAYGLREGWLYKQLDEQEQHRDPLIECAMAIGLPFGRIPAFSEALGHWTADLFPGETKHEKRIRLAVCALTDIAWREHEKIRAYDSFMRLLQFPFIGLSHPERAFVSTSILARYGGKIDDHIRSIICDLLSESELRRAEILGRTMLLGHRFSASVPEILTHARVKIDIDAVRLEILDDRSIPDSDAVQTRLRQLAKAAGLENIDIVNVEK